MYIRSQLEIIFTGQSTNDIVQTLQRDKRQLEALRHALAKQIPLRPSPSQFPEVYKSISEFVNNFAKGERVHAMIKKLTDATLESSKRAHARTEESLWQDQSRNVIARMETSYPQYRDVLNPFFLAVYQLKYGLRMLSGSAQHKGDKEASLHVTKLLSSLLSFPSASSGKTPLISIADLLDDSKCLTKADNKFSHLYLRFHTECFGEDSCFVRARLDQTIDIGSFTREIGTPCSEHWSKALKRRSGYFG